VLTLESDEAIAHPLRSVFGIERESYEFCHVGLLSVDK
jgi:hypothetical protein